MKRQPPSGSALASLESQLARHAAWLAVGATLLAFALRYAAARGRYLISDEFKYVRAAGQPDLLGVYRLGAREAHPPLFFFILHFWMLAGHSEVFLRSLSIGTGTATVFVLFLWVRRLFGSPAALAAAVIAAVTPILVYLSAQVRGYALMHLLIVSALFFQDRFFQSRRSRDLIVSAVAMMAAILTEYSAVFAAVALGAVASTHVVRRGLSRRDALLTIALQIATFAAAASLYLIQGASLHGSPVEHDARTGWLSRGYFHPEREEPWRFLLDRSVQILTRLHGANFAGQFLASRAPWAQLLAALAAIAVCLFIVRRRVRTAAFGDAIIAATVAYGATAAAALAGFFPYGPTRHDSVLLLFSLPLVALVISELCRGKTSLVILVSLVLAAYLWRVDSLHELVHPRLERRIESLHRAPRPSDRTRGDGIFADDRT